MAKTYYETSPGYFQVVEDGVRVGLAQGLLSGSDATLIQGDPPAGTIYPKIGIRLPGQD